MAYSAMASRQVSTEVFDNHSDESMSSADSDKSSCDSLNNSLQRVSGLTNENSFSSDLNLLEAIYYCDYQVEEQLHYWSTSREQEQDQRLDLRDNEIGDNEIGDNKIGYLNDSETGSQSAHSEEPVHSVIHVPHTQEMNNSAVLEDNHFAECAASGLPGAAESLVEINPDQCSEDLVNASCNKVTEGGGIFYQCHNVEKARHKPNRKLRNKGRTRRGRKWKNEEEFGESLLDFSYSLLSERSLRLMTVMKEAEQFDPKGKEEVLDLELSQLGSGDQEHEEGRQILMLIESSGINPDDSKGSKVCSSQNSEVGQFSECAVESKIGDGIILEVHDNLPAQDETVSQESGKNTKAVEEETPLSTARPTEDGVKLDPAIIDRASITDSKKKVKNSSHPNGNGCKSKSKNSIKEQNKELLKITNSKPYYKHSQYDILGPHEDTFLSSSSFLSSFDRLRSSVDRITDGAQRLREKKKWRTTKAHIQVKTKYCRSVQNTAHGVTYYAHHRIMKLMPMPPCERTIYVKPPKSNNVISFLKADRVNARITKTAAVEKPPRVHVTKEPPRPRYAITQNNADNELSSDLINLLISLQDRELSPEDYELLLRLDERVKPKTFETTQLDRFRTDVVGQDAEGGVLLSEVCAVCLEMYETGQQRKYLPCGHRFHANCIDDWLTGSSMNCPLDGMAVNL